MRKIILVMMTVLICAAYGYAESCSCGQGCLSYQISGCGEQKRACCSGTWCSWGTTSCASCTATSTSCTSISSSYCGGTATRTVTGTCGSCSYSSWNTSNCKITCGSWVFHFVGGTGTYSTGDTLAMCKNSLKIYQKQFSSGNGDGTYNVDGFTVKAPGLASVPTYDGVRNTSYPVSCPQPGFTGVYYTGPCKLCATNTYCFDIAWKACAWIE